MAQCSSVVSTVQFVNRAADPKACQASLSKAALFELEAVQLHFSKTFPECVFVALPLAEFSPENLFFPVVPPIMSGAHFNRLKSFFAGRYCVEKALGQTAAGRALLQSLAAETNEQGAEIFKQNDASFYYIPSYDKHSTPVWPIGIYGSITHSPLYAACLLSQHSDAICLGLDCESILTKKRAKTIENRIAESSELDLLLCFLREDSRLKDEGEEKQIGITATLLFSAKEAIFKAYHSRVGEFFGFSSYAAVLCTESKLVFQCRVEFGKRLSIERVEVQYVITTSSVWCAVCHKV